MESHAIQERPRPLAPGNSQPQGLWREFAQHRQTGPIPWWSYAVIAIALGLACVYATARLGQPVYPIDDAYITIYNAQSLVSGVDPNYGNENLLAGATSVIHVLLVAALYPVAGDWASWIVAWLGVFGLALGLAKLASVKGTGVWAAFLVVAVGLSAGLIWYQLLNGLETGLALAALAWTLVFASQPKAVRPLGLMLGTMPFIRPELAALSLLIGFWKLIDFAKARDGRQAQALAAYGLLGAAPWALLLLWHTGHVVPSTVGAKKAYFAESVGLPSFKWQVLRPGLMLYAEQMGLLVLGLVPLLFTNLGRVCLAFVATFYWAYWLEFPGAVHHYHYRYQYILLPILLLGLVVALSSKSKGIRYGAFGAGLLALVFGIVGFKANLRPYLASNDVTLYELRPLANWINENIPKDEPILIHDAGYVAYGTDHRLYDFVGLKTPEAISLNEALTLASRGRRRSEVPQTLALRHNIRYLIMKDGWEMTFGVVYGMQQAGWKTTPIRKGRYVVYRIEPPTSTR